MSKIVLIYPGSVSPAVSLEAALRESHEAAQASRAAEIAERVKLGVPLDDATNWTMVAEARAALASVGSDDSVALAAASARLHALVNGHALEALPDYVPVDGHADVMMRFRAVSEGRLQDLLLAVGVAHRAVEACVEGDVVAKRAANEARDQAFLAFIGATVVDVVIGDQRTLGADALCADDLEALRSAGLMVSVYLAARDYQRLSPGKGVRFGSPRP